MNSVAILAALNGAIEITTTLIPVVDQLKRDGLVTEEQQAAILAKYNSLKKQADGQFSGPQWELSGR